MTGLYLLLNLLYLYALPVKALADAPILPVAEKAAAALFGPAGARFVAALLCFAIAGGVSAMIWAGPHVYRAMALDGAFPAIPPYSRHIPVFRCARRCCKACGLPAHSHRDV